ncbi:MAG: ABC transporter substrate-binding protein [Chloroflexi bacterium]|nr:ABC transporter substrate-binding protein [Chloroflexota bacterium]
MKNKYLVQFLVSIFLIISLVIPMFVGCKNESNETKETVRFFAGVQMFPRTNNPFAALSTKTDMTMIGMIYEPLIVTDGATGDPIPMLAKSWEWDAASKAWIFHLNEKATFSDKTPVTAEDVKYSWETAWNVAAQYPESKAYITSVEVVDKNTVKFILKEPYSGLLRYMSACMIVPKAIWTTVGDIVKYSNDNPVGSGPFMLKEKLQDDHITFVKNPNYWNGVAAIDEVYFRWFGTAEAQLLALLKGEIDAMSDLGMNGQVPTLLQTENIRVYFSPAIDICSELLLNLRKEPFNLVEFRQALNIVISRRDIITQALAGYGKLPQQCPVAPNFSYAVQELIWPYGNMTQAERVTEANKKLDAIPNMSVKGTDGLRTYKGNKLIFDVMVSTSAPEYANTAKIITDNLKEIGVQFNIKSQTYTTLYGTMYRHLGNAPLGWDANSGCPANSTFVDFSTKWIKPEPAPKANGGIWNNPLTVSEAVGWTNPTIQAKFLQEQQEMDPTKLLALRQEIQRLWAAEMPCIVLYYSLIPCAYRTDKFTGWNEEFGGAGYGNGNATAMVSAINIRGLKPIEKT